MTYTVSGLHHGPALAVTTLWTQAGASLSTRLERAAPYLEVLPVEPIRVPNKSCSCELLRMATVEAGIMLLSHSCDCMITVVLPLAFKFRIYST